MGIKQKSPRDRYLRRIKLNTKSGDLMIFQPTMFNTDVFEKTLVNALGEAKKVPD